MNLSLTTFFLQFLCLFGSFSNKPLAYFEIFKEAIIWGKVYKHPGAYYKKYGK